VTVADLPAGEPARPWSRAELVRAAVLTSLAYYLGVRLGLELTFGSNPISLLWTPNALLLCALLLAPLRAWPLLVAAVLPAHLAAELAAGIPAGMALLWYVSNCLEALLGAFALRSVGASPPRFDRLRDVVFFLAFAALVAPVLSSFVDAAFVRLNGWGDVAYFDLWRRRALSNSLAALVVVPPVLTLAARARASVVRRRARPLEIALFSVALVALAALLLSVPREPSPWLPAAVYLPAAALVWSAFRFGPGVESCSFAGFALLLLWGASFGEGVFSSPSAALTLASVQAYLLSLQPPLLALAALIEESRQTGQRLSASEERFSTAFRSSPVPMSISRRRDGRILDVNRRWETLFGHARDEAKQRSLLELLWLQPPDYARILATGAGEHPAELELDAVARDGAGLRILVSITEVELEGERCLLCSLRDLTAQRRAEVEAVENRRQLTHLSRVHQLGELSGAIAHEVNQPLTAILANAQAALELARRTPESPAELRAALEDIVEADLRAAGVIHGLRAMLRKGESSELQPVALEEVLGQVVRLARGELVTRRVRLSLRLGRDLPRIRGDRVQLQQLFLNLVTNACDAMAEVPPEHRRLAVAARALGKRSLFVSLRDQGPGFDPAKLARVFEPFDSTKGAGLGLGLPICRTIVAAHGGRIWAGNRRAGGARVAITLPVAS
jgi:two-component system sensor kinase FixL